MSAKESIKEQFKEGALEYKRANEICRLLGAGSRGERDAIGRMLKELESEGAIVRDARGRFVTPEKLGLVRGTVQGHERGFAFLLREEGEDLFLPPRALHGALHKDVVLARPVGGERGDEAEVYCVLERGMPALTGTYERDRKGGIVRPDERRFRDDVRGGGGAVKAKEGEKVFVRLVAYPDGHRPEGVIEEVLGRDGDLETEETALVRTYGLAEAFPPKVTEEARRAANCRITAEGRADFRDQCVITIDGEDSRDFDDAVSVEKKGANFLLSVHIADVTHYVRRGSELDKEAFERGTSVYFPDRVLPMLPESLSNGVCSLNEGEDRYTLSCVMEVNGKGDVVDGKLAEGVIRSAHRMTYTKVAKMLEGDAALCAEYADILPMCEQMRELAEILIRKRDRRGSVDLDVREADIRYSDGRIEVRAAERDIAHRIIEEFMILANETVASFAAGWEAPFVYRVHDKPSEEKAEGFSAYLRELGLPVKFRPENVRPGEYGKILKRLGDGELARVVNRVMLRSMSKARYSEENAGHFGLASECYCHFTSPIRRYPDLLVHRIVKSILEGEGDRLEKKYGGFVANAAQRCSATERRAEEAERAVDELYKVWYMRAHLGESFEGVVSGVTAFGIFVELENTIEGRIRIEDLPEDDYTFVEERYLLRGKVHSYKIGDAMRVTVASCDIGTRRVDFVPAQGKRNEK